MRIVFFGTPLFAVPSLRALLHSDDEVAAIVTQPDKRRGRGSVVLPSPVKEIAAGSGIRILQPSFLKEPFFQDTLVHLNPELVVVVAYGKILPPQVLQIPRYGCINVHASLLPQYRGAAPVQWALIHGEEKTGITTMHMDEGLDTGDILLQEEVMISADDTAATLGEHLAETGASVLMRTIADLKDGSLHPVPQKGSPSYAPPLRKEDGKIVWTKTAPEIFNLVRGTYPWPGAYCHLNAERIKITRVGVLEGHGMPGRIEETGEALVVGTGKGRISLMELQPEGKRLMSGKDFLQGRRLKKGAFFDES